MPHLSISNEFLESYARLPKSVKDLVKKALKTFGEHTHAGLHLEKLAGMRDSRIRTIRISAFWRGVVLAEGDGEYVLLAVMAHDDAIDYARSRVFTVNTKLGVLETRDQPGLEQAESSLRADPAATGRHLFAHVKDKELHQLGIDAEILPLVRIMATNEHLDALRKFLPEAQYDALTGLALGYPVDEVWSQLCARYFADKPDAEVDPSDLKAAVKRMPDKFVTVSGPEDLVAMLQNPFALWRRFLHVRQENVAYRSLYTGPALVTGGAGTGKTVTLLHRAAFLARRLPPAQSAGILITTYTTNLVKALDEQLRILVDDRDVLSRIQVSTVNKVAYDVVKNHEKTAPDIVHAHAETRIWHEAARHIDNAVSGKFLRSEWEQVVLAQDLSTREAYLGSERKGRSKRLPIPKEVVWSGIEFALRQLREAGKRSHHQVVVDATHVLTESGRHPYRHVLVDEGQDLHPVQWRLLRALVAGQPDDLFIVSDPNQRIYDNRVSLESLGIRVRGRSKRLTVGYRTTQEILAWSVSVLSPKPPTGLDDQVDTLGGYRSQLHGPVPLVRDFPDRSAELAALAEQVGAWLEQRVEPDAIGVAARTKGEVAEARAALRHAGITDSAIRVETMHGMKGLEFRCSAVVGVNDHTLPLPAAVTPAGEDSAVHAQDTQRERCLLFVATTRPRDALYVSYVGRPSAFLSV